MLSNFSFQHWYEVFHFLWCLNNFRVWDEGCSIWNDSATGNLRSKYNKAENVLRIKCPVHSWSFLIELISCSKVVKLSYCISVRSIIGSFTPWYQMYEERKMKEQKCRNTKEIRYYSLLLTTYYYGYLQYLLYYYSYLHY